jgi:NitT/TauT family transport system ATP-binding protein/sulfonate transport system ATP-binding protein
MDEKKVILKLSGITQSFVVDDAVHDAVEDVSFEVYDNEFLVILGPGHCGKTVLMNILAGLEKAISGKIYLNDEELQGSDKRIGMVFQTLNLMPWRTVMGNVEFGLEVSGVPKADRRKTAQKYIDLVGLTGFEKAYPNQLSGGMKQRVGIARAYSNNPQILLMDEPFGQLDAQTRYAMQEEVLRIWEKEKRTIVFVTNNIEEAVFLADRIILLSSAPGKIKEVYELDALSRPRNTTSREFLKIRTEVSDNTDIAF